MKENWEFLFRNPLLKQVIKKLKFSMHFHLKYYKYDHYVSRANTFSKQESELILSEVWGMGSRIKKTRKHIWIILVTICCIWKKPYRKCPISIAQSKQQARVMQSFHLELNQFYSYYVYAYMSNLTPCCLVRLKKHNLNFHILL